MGNIMYLRKGDVHTAPVNGIPIGDLAVGSSVFLNENAALVEYLIVNQGIPSNSSSYDSSCNGTWLLRKDLLETRRWHSSTSTNNYSSAEIHTYLNDTFLNRLDTSVQALVKQVKIPYELNDAAQTGANGLSAKVFLLSSGEVAGNSMEGSYLAYFSGGSSTVRVARYNGTATQWWLRTPQRSSSNGAYSINTSGSAVTATISNTYGIRPALVLPSDTLIDEETMTIITGSSGSGSGSGGSEETPTTCTITVTGTGRDSECYLIMPDGTEVVSSGEYTLNKNDEIICCIKGNTPGSNNYISINGTKVAESTDTYKATYAYKAIKNATINLDATIAASIIIITEEDTDMYTITITGTGDRRYSYVVINNTTVTSAGTYKVPQGTLMRCFVDSVASLGTMSGIYVNGSSVVSYTGTYDYTVQKDISVALSCAPVESSSNGFYAGAVKITEEG